LGLVSPRVHLLRRRGRRLPRKEIENGSGYEGELSAYYMDGKGERFLVASLSGPRPLMVRVLPDLYEPVLVTLRDWEQGNRTDASWSRFDLVNAKNLWDAPAHVLSCFLWIWR
jgi:hypothetical protein